MPHHAGIQLRATRTKNELQRGIKTQKNGEEGEEIREEEEEEVWWRRRRRKMKSLGP